MKKKATRRKSRTKRRRSSSEDRAKTGTAGPGEALDPMAVPKDRGSDEASSGKPRPAPAPGVPVSDEEYERLKERAKTVRKRASKHIQEDPSEKK
jgi:hypothetical protein